MKISALVSPIALASALALSGGAFAQESMMIGEQTITDETEMAQVQNYCRDLLIADQGSEPNNMSEDEVDGEGSGIAELTSNINYSTITVEECETAFADMMDEDGMMMMEEEAAQ